VRWLKVNLHILPQGDEAIAHESLHCKLLKLSLTYHVDCRRFLSSEKDIFDCIWSGKHSLNSCGSGLSEELFD
jgi:hypothetical protein